MRITSLVTSLVALTLSITPSFSQATISPKDSANKSSVQKKAIEQQFRTIEFHLEGFKLLPKKNSLLPNQCRNNPMYPYPGCFQGDTTCYMVPQGCA